MKLFLKNIFLLFVFLFILFSVNRILFYSINFLNTNDVPIKLIFQTFFHSWRLDLSLIGYFMAIPLVFIFFSFIFSSKIVLKCIDYYIVFFIILYNLTAFGEACLYLEWKSKLSMRALLHFAHPEEVFKSASWFLIFLFFGLTILFSTLYIYVYFKKVSFYKNIKFEKLNILKKIAAASVYLIAITAFTVISIRGGVQPIPIQTSDAYFCNVPVVNDATVNPLWNIAHNILDYNKKFKENPYNYFNQKEADFIAKSIVEVSKDTTEKFLSIPKPNIVFIILESWSADCIKSFNGDNFAPFIDSISKEGISFTRFYAVGHVSDQGIPAVLSGYPALSRMSIINLSSKSVNLPSISVDLKKKGYSTSFYFGGDLNYGNIKSYIFQKNFDFVKEGNDFDSDQPKGKLGIQDNYMNKAVINELNTMKEPFLSSWFTLSTHMPYDYEGKKEKLTEIENDYVNSFKFTDKCLETFFKDAKKQSWYKNTLFVIVADHSHNSHKNRTIYEADYHRIPLLFYGDVIKNEFKGKVNSNVFSQIDIPYSLLKQMDMHEEAKQYVWSNDMFNPFSRNIAFFCSFGGSGMVNNEGYISFQSGLDTYINNSFTNQTSSDSLNTILKAFQQSVFEDFRLR